MKNFRAATLAQLVGEETAAAAVLEKYHLDFCCKGKRTLEEACRNQGVDLAAVTDELEQVFSKSSTHDAAFFQTMPLDALADYIIEKHHSYVRRMSPLLLAHTQKVADRHGKSHPELIQIADLFELVAHELAQHMFKEEQVLFPYIHRLIKVEKSGDLSKLALRPFVVSPIKVMEAEHEKAGAWLEEIRRLSNNYFPPDAACATYQLCFRELKEFEEDLHWHVHLENHFLFPQTIELEASLAQMVYE